jgi:hypothetical protein
MITNDEWRGLYEIFINLIGKSMNFFLNLGVLSPYISINYMQQLITGLLFEV